MPKEFWRIISSHVFKCALLIFVMIGICSMFALTSSQHALASQETPPSIQQALRDADEAGRYWLE